MHHRRHKYLTDNQLSYVVKFLAGHRGVKCWFANAVGVGKAFSALRMKTQFVTADDHLAGIC